MKIINKIMRFTSLLLIILMQFTFLSLSVPKAFAATPRVNLLTSDNFAVLAGSGITDVGTTAIVGDVGLSPTTGAAITGLTCSEVTGTIYDVDGAYAGGGGGSTACRQTNAGKLTQAKTDLTVAYNDAASRTTNSTVATELGGSTLTDGVYDSAAGTFGITGTLTLDGKGNADSVFIFKMASTLITASSSRVVLTNGAQACNVYWQVGSSATFGTSSNFVGNVLALTTITDNGSSTVLGRLLARNGAVNTNNTNVVISGCAAGTAGASNTSSSTSSSSGGSSSAVCPTPNSDLIVPSIIESKRVSPTSISISWGPYQGTNTFIVQYGPTNGNWLYSNNVTGFSATLNGLPSNQPIWWARVAPRTSCSIGKFGDAKLVGGPMLPNTGLAPYENNIPWQIPAGVFIGVSTLLFLIQRKHRFSSKS